MKSIYALIIFFPISSNLNGALQPTLYNLTSHNYCTNNLEHITPFFKQPNEANSKKIISPLKKMNIIDYSKFGPINPNIFIIKKNASKTMFNNEVKKNFKKRKIEALRHYGKLHKDDFEETKPYRSVLDLLQRDLDFRKNTIDLIDVENMIKLIVNYALAQDGQEKDNNSIIQRLRNNKFTKKEVLEMFTSALKRNPTLTSEKFPIVVGLILEPAHQCIMHTLFKTKNDKEKKLVLPNIEVISHKREDGISVLDVIMCDIVDDKESWFSKLGNTIFNKDHIEALFRPLYNFLFNDPN